MNLATLAAPFAFILAGFVVWLVAAHPKVSQAGYVAFACGVFWLVYLLSHAAVHV